MKLKLESNGVNLKLATTDGSKNIKFKTIVKAYELVTGDELEITENEPGSSEKPRERREINNYQEHDRPNYHEPVKTEVACPYCGLTGTRKVPFGYRFMNCPACGGKIFSIQLQKILVSRMNAAFITGQWRFLKMIGQNTKMIHCLNK